MKKVALGLALSFALVLLAVPAAEETGGVSQLSHQEMEGLFGGLNTCCDDCRDVAMDYSECDHGNNYPSTAKLLRVRMYKKFLNYSELFARSCRCNRMRRFTGLSLLLLLASVCIRNGV